MGAEVAEVEGEVGVVLEGDEAALIVVAVGFVVAGLDGGDEVAALVVGENGVIEEGNAAAIVECDGQRVVAGRDAGGGCALGVETGALVVDGSAGVDAQGAEGVVGVGLCCGGAACWDAGWWCSPGSRAVA